MIQLREYRAGDITRVRCDEADPYPGWSEYIEKSAACMRTVTVGGNGSGAVILVTGFMHISPGVADVFALVDRAMSRGYGQRLALMMAELIGSNMQSYGVHRVQAVCPASDYVASAFLRAIGFRKEFRIEAACPDGADKLMFKIIGSYKHG